MIRTLLPPILIVVLFYGYTAMLGTNHLVLDIGIFAAAVLAGEFCGHAVMGKRTTARMRGMAAIILIATTTAFTTLTFWHPSWFLFDDPKSRPHSAGPESR